jgi:uncharacterized protein (TIGR02246 family)
MWDYMSVLAANNVQIVLLEMQPTIVDSSRTCSSAALRRAAEAVKTTADALGIPILASVVPLGEEDPALIEELGFLSPLARTTISLFGNEQARSKIASSGRKVLAVGGVSSEIAILHTVLDARRAGYDVHLLMDCCAGLSDRSETAALKQMEAAGAVASNVSSFFTGLVDNMTSDAGRAVMDAMAKLWSWERNDKGEALPVVDINALFEEMSNAWRSGDATRFAAVFAPDAQFVAFDGTRLVGPEAIESFHTRPFETYLARSELILEVSAVRSLGLGTSIVSSQGRIVKEGDAQGDLTGNSAQTFLLRECKGVLKIEAFQNTRIRPVVGPLSAQIWKEFDQAWFTLERQQG